MLASTSPCEGPNCPICAHVNELERLIKEEEKKASTYIFEALQNDDCYAKHEFRSLEEAQAFVDESCQAFNKLSWAKEIKFRLYQQTLLREVCLCPDQK